MTSFITLGGSATFTVPTPIEPVGAFNSVAIANGNSDDVPSGYTDAYQNCIKLRSFNTISSVREGWTAPYNVGASVSANANFVALNTTLKNGNKFLYLNSFPGNANGKPGTWSTAVSPSAAYTAATEALTAWATEDFATFKTRHATFIANVKYAWLKKLSILDSTLVVNCQNEKDNSGIGSGKGSLAAVDVIMEDFPAALRRTPNAIAVGMRRYCLIAEAAQECMAGINLPAGTTALDRPWYFSGPAYAQETMPTIAPFYYGLRDLNTHFNAMYHKNLNIVSGNKHRIFSDLTRFDESEVPETTNHIINLWRWQDEATIINGSTHKPVVNTEGGQFAQFGVTSASVESKNGTWSGGTTIVPVTTNSRGTFGPYTDQVYKLLEYEAHMSVIHDMWYGLIGRVLYSNSFSGMLACNNCHWDPTVIDAVDGLPFSRFPHYDLLRKCWEPTLYDSRYWNSGFTDKDWTKFNELWTWGVFKNERVKPSRVYPDNPYLPWDYTFFGTDSVPSGVMEMRPWASLTGYNKTTNDRMIACKPVYCAYPNREHRFQVKVQVPSSNAATRAKLRVRGYNKLRGHVGLSLLINGNDPELVAPNWKTVGIDFNLVGHGLSAYPEMNYALCVIDYENGTGATSIQFKEPEILY